jgi:hypothetical protein
VRKAWLALGGQSVSLDDPAAGYFCQSLDLGAPVVRNVTVDRPDQHGMDDRTAYFGGRTVVANLVALVSAGAQIDAIASQFGPYMLPSARPVLHYVLDRPGASERVLTVRGESYDYPIVGATQRDIVLTFVAADPILRDAVAKYATATPSAAATLQPSGDLPAQPSLQINGPITAPQVTFQTLHTDTPALVAFVAGYAIAAGHYVLVDTVAHTALVDGDPAQSAAASIDWTHTVWPVIPSAPDGATMAIAGSATTSATEVLASWQDGYLT